MLLNLTIYKSGMHDLDSCARDSVPAQQDIHELGLWAESISPSGRVLRASTTAIRAAASRTLGRSHALQWSFVIWGRRFFQVVFLDPELRQYGVAC